MWLGWETHNEHFINGYILKITLASLCNLELQTLRISIPDKKELLNIGYLEEKGLEAFLRINQICYHSLIGKYKTSFSVCIGKFRLAL